MPDRLNELETTYSYDAADRVTAIDYSDEGTPDVAFEYDADGNVLAMTDGTGESSFEYDKIGRLISAEDGHGDVVEYDYNLANEQTGITYPNGKSVIRTYDDAGRLESVTAWLEGTIGFAYDADSNLEGIVFPAATERLDDFAYNPTGLMEEVKFESGGETLASINYARDKASQIEAITTQELPGPAEQEFSYDQNGRLTESSAGSYEFDAGNNLVKSPTAVNKYDAANQLEEGGGVAYSYSAVGERTKATPESGPTTSYAYDQAGGLTLVERPEEGEIASIDESFTYDGSRLAASHAVGETVRYLTWDTSHRLPRLLSDGDRSFIYGPGGIVIAQIDSEENPSYYHHDQLGSTRMLSDSAGVTEGAFSYEPFGELEASSGSGSTPIKFAGQYTATESGLQYLRARQYDTATGQFMSKDPLAALTREPYAYGAGNPLTYTDPTGLGLCIASLIDCDEDDDPCASPLSWSPLCFLPDGASDPIGDVSTGIGDSLLEPLPSITVGPWLRDWWNIDGVENCSAAYRFSKTFTDWVTIIKGVSSAGKMVSKHLPDLIKAGRDIARKQNERIVHLPPEAMP